MRKSSRVLIGTSGWMYKDWNEKFFPGDLPLRKRLSFYAGHFRSIEINVSFYRMPARETFRNWRKAVGKDFVFSVKLNQYLTHRKRLILDEESADYLDRFLRSASGLKEKFAALLIQLPPSSHARPERLSHFLRALRARLRRRKFRPDVAVEFRHPSWFTEQTYAILRSFKAALVIGQSARFPSEHVFTADFSYIRMHGPGALFASRYTRKELAAWASFITRGQQKLRRFYVYFNNDYRANAIDNAGTLLTMLR